MKKSVFRLLAFIPLVALIACCKDKEPDPTPEDSSTMQFGTGWDSSEPYAQTIPVALNYGNYQTGGTLPARVDLTPKFPPVQRQSLATCVGWAVGYNTKSYLDGVAKNLTSPQLQSPTNQYSPIDLFFSINAANRSCKDGTQFDYAFNALISRGVNTLAAVPDANQCYSTSPGSPVTAAANKIKSYRRIAGAVNEIKQYLAQGVPVVIGAMVNAQFERWQGSGVLTTLNYAGNATGHAMVIAGYDDAKGAFRLINSWGTNWGDQGYAWVEYNFLVNTFCVQGGQKSLFVAFNDNPTTVAPPTTAGSAPDLTAVVTSDFSMYPALSSNVSARRSLFDVKNIGNQIIYASSNWNIYYLWVNAFNANNYGIIFRGEFTTAVPSNTYQNVNANYARLNYNLAPGSSLGQVTGGRPFANWDYFMPTLTGNYYLVLYIDKGSSNEANQTNNVFYVTQTPKYFANGYSARSADSLLVSNRYKFENMLAFKHELPMNQRVDETALLPYRQLSKKEFLNSYSSEEVIAFLKYKIRNGGGL